MRNLTLLICLLLGFTACEQTSEPKEQESTASNKAATEQKSLRSEEIKDEDRYPLFFIEVAKNLNIPTQEFAQAMTRAGDNNASMENVAKELGISLADLQAALPKRPARKITFEPATGVEVVEPEESQVDTNVSE